MSHSQNDIRVYLDQRLAIRGNNVARSLLGSHISALKRSNQIIRAGALTENEEYPGITAHVQECHRQFLIACRGNFFDGIQGIIKVFLHPLGDLIARLLHT